MLHVMSLTKLAAAHARSWAANSPNARLRLRAENERLQQEVALLRAEIRIKDARMKALTPHHRPFYPPPERLEILEVRAARGWSLQQTAEAFLVCSKTIASWMTRLEESGPRTLVQLRTPVNKFPEFIGYAVKRLQALCPTLGKKKLAQILARAGLHLSATTIGRLRQEKPSSAPPSRQEPRASGRIVTAKRPNHVWHIDLTTVPTQSGFWCSWLPFAVPQCWPFAWWLVVVLDHYSRRSMGCAVLRQAPRAAAIRSFLGRVIRSVGTAPKYLISDKGSQFWPTPSYQHWCRRRHIRPRFGALGAHGSIAVLERAWQTINALRPGLVPIRRQQMCRDLSWLLDWYNRHRPHTTLGGQTPDEVYSQAFPANRRPRLEPRLGWPRPSACAKPQVLVAGQPGAKFSIEIEHFHGNVNLPIVRLRRAA